MRKLRWMRGLTGLSAEVVEVAEGADETDVVAIYILSYGENTIVIGYMALWGFWSKSWTGLDGYPLDCYDY